MAILIVRFAYELVWVVYTLDLVKIKAPFGTLEKVLVALVIWAANQEAHTLVCWDDFCNWARWAFRLLGNKSYTHSRKM